MAIKWNRSADGYILSKCGVWEITPLFLGQDKPQMYQVLRGGFRFEYTYDTQSGAKMFVNEFVKRNPDQ